MSKLRLVTVSSITGDTPPLGTAYIQILSSQLLAIKFDNGVVKTLPTPVSVHSSLTGLLVDDHPQYALVDGLRTFNKDHFTEYFEDWITFDPEASESTWEAANLGVGDIVGTSTFVNGSHVGIIAITTGNFNQNYRSLRHSTIFLVAGGGELIFETIVRMDQVMATAPFIFSLGLGDEFDADEHNNGIYFQHDQSSNNWLLKTASGGIRTTLISSTVINTSSWYKLKFVVNAIGNSVEGFLGVNGATPTSFGTIVTNIPSLSIGPVIKRVKDTATGAGTLPVYCDTFGLKKLFTTPR